MRCCPKCGSPYACQFCWFRGKRLSGKITKAPCGHKGEAIIGGYIQCLEGCGREEAAPEEEIEPEKTEPLPVVRWHGVRFI